MEIFHETVALDLRCRDYKTEDKDRMIQLTLLVLLESALDFNADTFASYQVHI